MDKLFKIIFSLLFIFLGLTIIGAILAGYDVLYLYPESAEYANNYCKAKDYAQYTSFQRKPLTTTAYGIRCETIQIDIPISLN